MSKTDINIGIVLITKNYLLQKKNQGFIKGTIFLFCALQQIHVANIRYEYE